MIERQINGPGIRTLFHQPYDDIRYLLPGRPASEPQQADYIQKIMRENGLPTLSARNTAMIDIISELPPIVVSDLFAIHPSTAHQWARYAQDSWADYLAACQSPE